MRLRNTANQYGILSRSIHWVLALLILLQYAYIWIREGLLEEKSEGSINLLVYFHKPFGLVILLLTIGFIAWKCVNKHPHYPTSMAVWEKTAARVTHGLLLVLTLVMAISGLTMSVAAGYPPSFFGFYTLPLFIAKNPELAKQLANVHESCGFLLLAFILLHIAAALKHHFMDKDNILKRMKL